MMMTRQIFSIRLIEEVVRVTVPSMWLNIDQVMEANKQYLYINTSRLTRY